MQDFLKFACSLLSEKSLHIHLTLMTFLFGHGKDWYAKNIRISHQKDFPENKWETEINFILII